eukprot:8149478-Ditylum_brightwellii.AAC.1
MVKATDQLLNIFDTYPNAIICSHANSMILYRHSNVAYIVIPEARHWTGGHFFLGNKPTTPAYKAATQEKNGMVHQECSTICNVVASVTETEVGGLYVICTRGEEFRVVLEKMGDPQSATHIITDNSTAEGIANNKVKQRKTRAMDMRFYCIRDRIKQGHFLVYWHPGGVNQADYSTTHFPPEYHKKEGIPS